MARVLELIGADVCRDGGSIALDYRKDDGALVSVFLEVNRYLDGEAPTYGHLHVGSEIQTRCDASTIVSKGSDEERALLRDIEALSRLTPTGARSNTMHWLGELRERLSGRTG